AVPMPRTAAVTSVRILERVQPLVECKWFEIGLDHRGRIEEIVALETDRAGAVDRRHHHGFEALSQRIDRGAQVCLRLEVAAEAEVGAAHAVAGDPGGGGALSAGMRAPSSMPVTGPSS